MNPGDARGCIFRFRDLKRGVGWVYPQDSTAVFSEQDRQAACPGNDIEYTPCAQFASDAEVGSQIITVTTKKAS